MSSHTPPPETESGKLYEYFEEALGLYHEGKPYDSVLARCPSHLRVELRKQLELATRLVTLSPSMAQPRNQAHRSAQRAAYMREVRKLQPQPVISTGKFRSRMEAARESLQGLAGWMESLTPRLAPQAVPLLVAISLLLGSTIGVGTAAASALPGDFTYPVKEFVRERREDLASPQEKEKVIEENENARRADNEKAAIERSHLITVTQVLVFYQKSDWLLDIGGQSVMPGYPTDDSGETLVQMSYEGDPQPGNRVELTYMIVPGKPNFVYGVHLKVLSPPVEPAPTSLAPASSDTQPAQVVDEPTPTPVPPTPISVAPTAVPTLPSDICEPVRPDGWIIYRMQASDNLTSMAIRMGTGYAQILNNNCRTDADLGPGVSLFLPAVEGVTVPETDGETETPISTLVPAITATPEEVATETPEIEATATTESVATPTAENEQPTSEAEASPTSTIEEEEPTSEPTEQATEESATATVEATATALPATPTTAPTAAETSVAPTATPTPENTAVPTVTATEEASATETQGVTPTTVEATPTTADQVTPSATNEAGATDTPIASEPTATSVIPATVAPTVAEAPTSPPAGMATEPPPAVDTPTVDAASEATPTAAPPVESTAVSPATPTEMPPVEATSAPALEPTQEPTAAVVEQPTSLPVQEPTIALPVEPTVSSTVAPAELQPVEPTLAAPTEAVTTPLLDATTQPPVESTAQPTPTTQPTPEPTEPIPPPTAPPDQSNASNSP